MQNRLVRRIMKREGDGVLATLVSAFSCIYGGEGYYVLTDALFYEDISANLYQQTAADVKRILTLAAEYGIFDATLFRECGVLTSAEIQKQYLFSTKRRKTSAIDSRFNLITDEQEDSDTEEQEETTEPSPETPGQFPESATNTSQNVTFIHENVTSGTHSIAQNSIAQQSIEYPLLNSSPKVGTQDADRESAEGDGEEEFFPSSAATTDTFSPSTPSAPSAASSRQPRKEWTAEDVRRMQPPQDGMNRNLDGLLFNLRQFGISPQEQRAIILKSNFGIIGHPMWKGFSTIRESCGKIRQPGKFLLSLCNKG